MPRNRTCRSGARIIHLCMAGGPSQFETLDWKPQLKKSGQPFPIRYQGQR